MSERPLETAISGSFKFKPEIDALHDEFADFNVIVLAPDKGWLWLPRMIIVPPLFRPLPSERGMSIREIEDRFLESVSQADFLYVCDPEGYIGEVTGFEIGYAIGKRKPIYAQYPFDAFEVAEGDLQRKAFLEYYITIASPAEAARLEYAKREG